MIRYLEEVHGTTTSNGQDSEDTKYEGQEEELPKKLQRADVRPRPNVRRLMFQPAYVRPGPDVRRLKAQPTSATVNNGQRTDDRTNRTTDHLGRPAQRPQNEISRSPSPTRRPDLRERPEDR